MKRLITAGFLLFFLTTPVLSFAWGVLGHRVIGGIADHYLSAPARKEIRKILGNESIAMASGWADFIKSDRSYDYLSPWHYINLPKGLTREQLLAYLKSDTNTDVYTRLNFIIRELKSKKLTKEKQVFYLRLLIHLIGDVHQPMHAARAEDRGGNSIKLYWFGTPTNLHRVWDEQLVEFQQLSFTEHIQAINFTAPAQVSRWQRHPIGEWIAESYQISEKLYAEVGTEDKLGYAYNFRHVNTMNEQLLKGGVRLAGVLNEIFGAPKK